MKITKLTAVLFVMAMTSASLFAHNAEKKEKITFGVRAGLNYSNIIVKNGDLTVPLGQFNPALEGQTVKGKGGFNFDPKPSWYVGLTVDIPVKKWFHLQPELLYVQNYGQGGMGADFESTPYIPTFPSHGERPEDLRLTYIQIPVLAKFYVLDKLPLMVGPYVGIGTGFKGKPTAVENPTEKDIDYMYKSMDFGAMAGVAYEFGFGLFVEARYVFGMTNTLNNKFTMEDLGITTTSGNVVTVDLDADTNDISGQNNSFQIGVGFRF